MTRNQLPEGVGKKIVEALKRQAEADITVMGNDTNTISNSIPLTDIEDLPEGQSIKPSIEIPQVLENDVIIEEEEVPQAPMAGVYKTKEEQSVDIPVQQKQLSNPIVEEESKTSFSFAKNIQQENIKEIEDTMTINLPANVLILKKLISNLPVGVTKQTGAQIIRQTIEAMGIPMNSVLKEAQEIQEELNSSTRECMLKIQEYKTNIMQLEQSVQEYQRNITQINDLVSLFLLTDRNR